MSTIIESKGLKKERILEKLAKKELPHLYSHKFYTWMRKFWDSKSRIDVVVCPNQVGKSSTSIRRLIHRCTEPTLWPALWPNLYLEGSPLDYPSTHWYLYPTMDMASREFEEKWKLYLPNGSKKDDAQYGWEETYDKGEICTIDFKLGPKIYFMSYAQGRARLQSTSCHSVCFVAGTQIMTALGPKAIETLKVGDLVVTRRGVRPIRKTMVRKSPVIIKRFVGGSTLEGTVDHPVWTIDKGWVGLGLLSNRQICGTLPLWKLIRKLCFLRDGFLSDSRKALTIEPETTMSASQMLAGVSALAGAEEAAELRPELRYAYMSLFGKNIMGRVLAKITLFITKTLIPLIIASRTLSELYALNIQESTSSMNGQRHGGKRQFARFVAKSLKLVGLKRAWLVSAATLAEDLTHSASVSTARKCSGAVETITGAFVPRCAPIETLETKNVYNIHVEECHEYFANGILVHNCLDEEPPQALFDEFMKRVSATDGHVSIVFTATEAQQFWIEVVETKKKVLPDSQVQQVSLLACGKYEDGSASPWTPEKIAREIALCSSERQVQRRVYGRIVRDEGLKYESFDRKRNLRVYHPIPASWLYYAGIDYGGGGTSHPAAVGVIAVSPEYDKGRLVRLWRGDEVVTDAKDIIDVYRLMVSTLPMPPIQTTYDWAAKDLHTIASRMGLALTPAEKGHAIGEHTLNTLFKNGALVLMTLPEDTSKLNFPPEHLQTDKVVWELESLSHDTSKKHAKDDAIDGGLRYIVTKVPWDFEKICGGMNIDELFPQKVVLQTREQELRIDVNSYKKGKNGIYQKDAVVQEIEECNEFYDG